MAELFNVDPATVSRYRRWAVQDGYLKEIKPYEFKGKGQAGKATEFRFDVRLFPCLTKLAPGETAYGFQQ